MWLKSLPIAAATAMAMFAVGSPSALADVPLPTANCGTVAGTNCLQFDDFTVYSLALLDLQNGDDGKLGPKSIYHVTTVGIDLQNELVVGTGSSGQGPVNSDLIGGGNVDDAFA